MRSIVFMKCEEGKKMKRRRDSDFQASWLPSNTSLTSARSLGTCPLSESPFGFSLPFPQTTTLGNDKFQVVIMTTMLGISRPRR